MSIEQQIDDWAELCEVTKRVRSSRGKEKDDAIKEFFELHKKYYENYKTKFTPYEKPK